jgi:hypothetical protein
MAVYQLSEEIRAAYEASLSQDNRAGIGENP